MSETKTGRQVGNDLLMQIKSGAAGDKTWGGGTMSYMIQHGLDPDVVEAVARGLIKALDQHMNEKVFTVMGTEDVATTLARIEKAYGSAMVLAFSAGYLHGRAGTSDG